MFENLASKMERMLYTRINPSASDIGKGTAKIGTLGGALYAGTNLLASKVAAYAAENIEKIKEICDPENIYKITVQRYNFNLDGYVSQFPDTTLEERWGFLGSKQTLWHEFIEIKTCIETNGGNPDDIEPIGRNLAEVVNWYMAVIPEFPENMLKTLTIAGAIGSALAFLKIKEYVKSKNKN